MGWLWLPGHIEQCPSCTVCGDHWRLVGLGWNCWEMSYNAQPNPSATKSNPVQTTKNKQTNRLKSPPLKMERPDRINIIQNMCSSTQTDKILQNISAQSVGSGKTHQRHPNSSSRQNSPAGHNTTAKKQ